jgi:hypothetical protein
MGITKLKTEGQRGATARTPALDKPRINNIIKTVMGRLSAGMKSQGAKPHTLL